MSKVSMFCPHFYPLREFDTGFEVEQRDDLATLATRMVKCPHCDDHHYVRRPFLQGEQEQPVRMQYEGLEADPVFAMEVGIIIGSFAFMDSLIPSLYQKLTGHYAGHVFSAIPSIRGKVSVLEITRDTTEDMDLHADLKIIIAELLNCIEIRNFYAHAKYQYSGGTHHQMQIFPFFNDATKRRAALPLPIDEVRTDADTIQRTRAMASEYLLNNTRPTAITGNAPLRPRRQPRKVGWDE